MKLSYRPGWMIILSCFVVIVTSSSTLAHQIKINNNSNQLQVLDNSALGFRVVLDFSEFNTLDIKSDEGLFTRILAPAYARSGEYGQPELPVSSHLIEIPFNASVAVQIIRQSYKDFQLHELGINFPVMPHQPPASKSNDFHEFIYDKNAYQLNAFTPAELAVVENLGIMRGVNIGRLDIHPLQYNPAAGTIRVYESLEIEISFIDGDQAATELAKNTYLNHYFQPMFRALLNFREPQDAGRENFSRYPIKYVIVADPMFEAQLQPFIEWKTRKGFNVIEAYTNDPTVGTTTTQIKAYLQGLYTNATPEDPAPTFILFVGDIQQIPTYNGQAASHVTDLYYCEYTNDYFPEIFYGRFSAQNPAQLQPQIDKTLMYEQYTMPISSYLDTVVMIAGMDGTYGAIHGNGQINYGTINYFNASNGIYSHTYLYPASGSNAANIRQNISDGVTFANYTAHCSPSGWADPSFSTSHIAALQNNGKYGVLVGNCCSSSEYQLSECFGEAIVRAQNKGAVGYIGASNSTYWNEDYYFGVGVGAISGTPPPYEQTTLGFYDRAFHTHGEPFGEWYTTADQMIYAGNLAVTEGSPSMARYYWEAYCLMGDPSLMVYFSEPPAMTVNYDPLIPLGSQTFTVNAVPYAYVGLSMNNVYHGAALADQTGMAVIDIVGTVVPGMADVVVTAQNYQPFEGQVLIANPEGPFIMMEAYVVDDELGNNNAMIDYGEEIKLDVSLKNWGSAASDNTQATLMTSDQYVTITEDTQEYGTIQPDEIVMQEDAFRFTVAEFIPDMHTAIFQLEIEGTGRETWSSSFSLTLYAPVLAISHIAISDFPGGNGNGRLDEGETANIFLYCQNNGHSDATNVLATLASSSQYVTINNNNIVLDNLPANTTLEAIFSITLADEIPSGTIIDLNFNLSAGPYTAVKSFYPKVGIIIEDFETGNFEAFDWYSGGNQPWQITTQDPYQGVYSARSGGITHSQTSELKLDLFTATDDSISFYRRVSCEDGSSNNYDYLAFFIDGNEMERWDGEVAWSKVSYPVPMGQHTFTWRYSKDGSVSSGADAAWIDYIVFPALLPEGAAVVLNQFLINDESGNDNGMAEYGEEIKLTVELKNMGATAALNISATLSSIDEYVTITDDFEQFGDIASLGTSMREDAYQFVVAELVPDMHDAEFLLEIQGAGTETWTSSFQVTLYAPVMAIGDLSILDATGGNGNSALDAGETVELVIICHNTGHSDAFSVLASLESTSPYITIHNSTVSFDQLAANDWQQAAFTITLADVIETGTVIDLSFTLSSGAYTDAVVFYPQVGMIIENFESGNFNSFGWYHGGVQPWTITGENVYEGSFSARSGEISHGQVSELMIDIMVYNDDKISFYMMVSCEDDPENDDWDYMAFFIDEVEIGRWDGEVAWNKVEFPIQAGEHSLKWIYRKDASNSAGADAAWIDYITFPGSVSFVSVGESIPLSDLSVNIYPNPARDHFDLYLQLSATSRVSVTLYDLTGKKAGELVREDIFSEGSHRISAETGNLKAGIYFCVLQSGNQKVTKKLVITK